LSIVSDENHQAFYVTCARRLQTQTHIHTRIFIHCKRQSWRNVKMYEIKT